MSGASAKNEPQINADKRRFIVPGLHNTCSLPAGPRQWKRSERGLGFTERENQMVEELRGMILLFNLFGEFHYIFRQGRIFVVVDCTSQFYTLNSSMKVSKYQLP